MKRETTVRAIEENKLIVILRGLSCKEALFAAEAMYAGGIRLIEVTFDQSGKIPLSQTTDTISSLCSQFDGRLLVGAGTVMNTEQVDAAYNAGAGYIISPDSNEAVIRHTRERNMVSIPGAFTPTEAASAARYGADYVKLFPCSQLDPSYIKAIRAPLSHIRFLAVGGIDENNLAAYLSAGVAGVGVGTHIANKADIVAGNSQAIRERALRYTQAIKNYLLQK